MVWISLGRKINQARTAPLDCEAGMRKAALTVFPHRAHSGSVSESPDYNKNKHVFILVFEKQLRKEWTGITSPYGTLFLCQL